MRTPKQNKCFIELNYSCLGLQKNKRKFFEVNSKLKALRHFKVDPILKTDGSMWAADNISCIVHPRSKSRNMAILTF